jgi:hypothetical protein
VIRRAEQNLGNGSRGLGPVELPDRYDMGTDARLGREEPCPFEVLIRYGVLRDLNLKLSTRYGSMA